MNSRIFPSLVVAIIALNSSTAFATSFEDYIQRLNEHPQVMARLSDADALKDQAQGELGLPDPTLIIGIDNVPVSDPSFDRFLPTSKIIGFNQKIPNPILLRAKANKIEQLSEKQKLIADYTAQRLQFMLITKLAEYKAVKVQAGLIKKQLGYYHELEDTFKGQIESGRSVYQRFSEVDVERAEAERKLNDIDARKISIEAEFIRLINEVPDIAIPDISDLTWSDDMNSIYPVLIAAEDVDIAKRSVGIADAAFLPNFGVNAVYKQRENAKNGSFSGDDWFSVQAQVTIPLWASKNQKPKLSAAQGKERSAIFAYDDISSQWKQKMVTLESMRDAAAKNVKVLHSKDKAMGGKVSAARRNYEAGTEDLDRVLLAKIDRLNIQSQLAQVKYNYVSKAAEFNSNIINGFKDIK